MYEPLTDIRPQDRLHRWIWLAMPDDAAQEVRITYIEYPRLTDAARAALISDRLRELARQCWRRDICRPVRRKTRPDKLRAITDYRADSGQHRAARTKVTPERRREIAAMGQAARKARKEMRDAA